MRGGSSALNAPLSVHFGYKKTIMLYIRGLSPGLLRLLTIFFVLRPESSCLGRLVPSGLFYFAHYFIEVFVHGYVLRISALHHVPEFCHCELWTSSFLVELRCIPIEYGSASVPHRSFNFWVSSMLRCISSIRFLASSSSSRNSPRKALIVPLFFRP